MNARLRLALLFLPVLLQLCLFRLTEFTISHAGMATGDFDLAVGPIIWSHAPPFLLAILLPVGLYLAVRMAAPQLRRWLAFLPGAGLVLILFLLAQPIGPEGSWLRLEALRFILLDLFIVMAMGAVLLLGLERTPGAWRRMFTLLAHLIAAVASLLLTLNFGYYLKTGTSGDWLLFFYAMQTFHETQDVIASEISVAEVVLLALPALIALTPLVLARIPAIAAVRPAPRPAARRLFWAVTGCLVFALVVQTAGRQGVSGTGDSLFAGFVREAASVRETPPRNLLDAERAFDAVALSLAPTPFARPMNVVFIILESVRADALTPYDPTLSTTPFLDSLAATGLTVERMYAPVAHTTKALVPLLAGIYPSLQLHFPESRPGGLPARALPQLLAPLGYRSAFFSPAPLAFENKEGLLRNMGFDVLRGDGSFDTAGFDRIGYFGFEDLVVLKPAIDWVDETVRDGAPFFLSILTLTTHHPYNPPSAYAQGRYDARLPDKYLNAVASTDAFVRDLHRAFASRGLLEETLFVIVSDHGEAFREHGMTGHNQVLWDEVLHVPCVLHNPVLFESGTRVSGPRSQVDLLPTIADLLGLSIEHGRLPGLSLLEETPPDRIIYHSAWNSRQGLALRDASMKYMYFYRRERMKAFQYVDDPDERQDAARSLPDDLLREVEQELTTWRWSVAAAYTGTENARATRQSEARSDALR